MSAAWVRGHDWRIAPSMTASGKRAGGQGYEALREQWAPGPSGPGRRFASALAALALWVPACALAVPVSRIVSLDYCADQFAIALAGRERILAVSPDATAGFSFLRDAAHGIPTLRPRAEDVLVARPDLVIRSYGGGPGMAALLRRAGIPVVQIGFAENLDDVRATVRQVATALGTPLRGEALVHDMDARIDSLGRHPPDTWALYVTPSGVTAGPGTLVHELLRTVGLRNFQTEPGWRPLPLERLAYERPDIIAYASFGDAAAYNRAWTPARHPVARARMAQVPVVTLNGATTACGGWFVIHALEALALFPRP